MFWFGASLPKLPKGVVKPTTASELEESLNSLIPKEKAHRLVAIILDVASTLKPKAIKKHQNLYIIASCHVQRFSMLLPGNIIKIINFYHST